MDESHHGSRLCGAVRYRVNGALKAFTHCHCRKCQKAHGAAFATYASAPISSVEIEAEPGVLKGYESSPGVIRQFCSACGSSLFWSDTRGRFADWISIAVASLDSPVQPGKQRQGCVEERVGWYGVEGESSNL